MMTDVAIIVEGLGKKYSIGKEKDGSLKGALTSFLKTEKTKNEDFWALKGLDLNIEKGDIVGVIGKNGAGKSTFLKVLSKITKPTEGRIEINGRVASLLEVGTGFHPELTGRENIYLNGTILGMTRKEVAQKFDEIVAFSGIRKFIDTPVKRYSSGQYVRLAFAVAAHLEPDILIIDEVLAVGDAEFQKKCLGKMKDVANKGRTVLFVSHNLSALKNICNKGVLLEKGRVSFAGSIDNAINAYINSGNVAFEKSKEVSKLVRERGALKLAYKKIIFNSERYYPSSLFEMSLEIEQRDLSYEPEFLNFGFHIVDQYENQIYHLTNTFHKKENVPFKENGEYTYRISQLNLKPGIYNLWFWLECNGEEQDWITEGVQLEVLDGNVYGFSNSSKISGIVQPEFNFTYR
jgi:lipopolysaccharide transport system ATP-binding protein